MDRAEAEREAAQFQAEHPERDTYRFFAQQSPDGDWRVAKVRVPAELRRSPLTPTIDASPQPSPADDPRSGHEARSPGVSGGLGL